MPLVVRTVVRFGRDMELLRNAFHKNTTGAAAMFTIVP